MRETTELLKEQRESLKERLKVDSPNLEKAKGNMSKIEQKIIDAQIKDILRESESQLGKVTIFDKNEGNIKISYVDSEGKPIEKTYTRDELLKRARDKKAHIK